VASGKRFCHLLVRSVWLFDRDINVNGMPLPSVSLNVRITLFNKKTANRVAQLVLERECGALAIYCSSRRWLELGGTKWKSSVFRECDKHYHNKRRNKKKCWQSFAGVTC
jgi:hypothetical protein